MTIQLQWPVDSKRIIEYFLQNSEYWGNFEYTGIDDATHPYPGNDGVSIEATFKGDVVACADGVVKVVELPGDVRPNGNTVILEHKTDGATYQTIYCHLFKIGVVVGQGVKAGEVIATADSSGSVIGSQLRLVVRKVGASAGGETVFQTPDGRSITLMNDTVDPADYLNPAPEERYAQPARTASTFKDDLNIRSGPGTNFGVMYTAPKGDELAVQGISEDSKWYKILHDEREGWGFTEYIDFVGDEAELDVIEYVYTVPVQEPDFPLRGLHDGQPRYHEPDSAAQWMVKNGVQGWAVDMAYCLDPNLLDKLYPDECAPQASTDYTYAANAGVRVIIRWNFSFAKSEGGGGTFGDPSNDDRLIEWMARGIKHSKGVWGHIIGNEPNRAGENHDYVGGGNIGTPITPQRIAHIVKGVKKLVGPDHRISPPALDGTNTEAYFAYRKPIDVPDNFYKALLDALDPQDVDWIALHGYSRGSQDDPANDAKFGNAPLLWQYFGFRMWEPFAQILREKGPDWERLPIVITETNHLKVGGVWNAANHNGWDDNSDGANWIRKAYDYVQRWNQQPNDQYVHGLVLYRLSQDEWEIENKPGLLGALRQSGENPL
jgi:hypothetical protein